MPFNDGIRDLLVAEGRKPELGLKRHCHRHDTVALGASQRAENPNWD